MLSIPIHEPVMRRVWVEHVLAAVHEKISNSPRSTEPIELLDCTLGSAGHLESVLNALLVELNESERARLRILAIDRDPLAVARSQQRIDQHPLKGQVELKNLKMSDLPDFLKNHSPCSIMADLGYSSDQLEEESRGLSFLTNGPLDMRLNQDTGESLQEKLRRSSEEEIYEILSLYGQERFARQIARSLNDARRKNQLPRTTKELSLLIVHAIPSKFRHSKIHAATRSFQAFRIWVNDEMGELDILLKSVILKLCHGGRAGVMSFHSLEDGKVKHHFRTLAQEGFEVLTKKPITATDSEISLNPRARSAKLRVIRRC